MIEIFAVGLTEERHFDVHKKLLLSFLPEVSRNAVLRHKTQQGAQRTLLGEVLSRRIISRRISKPMQEIVFNKSSKGKPFLDHYPIHFNVSHSGDWVVLAVADTDVGIDIEKIRQIDYKIAERFFSKDENSLLEKQSGSNKLILFFDFWTIKESYLKMLGTGLTKSLSSFTVERTDGKFILRENMGKRIKPVYFRQYKFDEGYTCSVCSYGHDFINEPVIVKFENLLNNI